MAIYIDSANIEEVTQAVSLGWLYGITTNPTILAQAGTDPLDTLSKLADFNVKEIYYQVHSAELEVMEREARMAGEVLGNRMVIKIPPTSQGFSFAVRMAPKALTCITAIYSVSQALVARSIGARYIAVYVNRATRLLGDGIKMTTDIAKALSGSSTEIIAASLKSPDEAAAASLAGAHHLTLPFNVLMEMTGHPLSRQAVEEFDEKGIYISPG